MKKEKICAILFYIAAFCFYMTAMIIFVSHSYNSNWIVFLCLGSTMLCLGSVWLSKLNKSEEDKEEKK